MLAEANAHGGDIQWIEADAASWNPERPVDLIFSNAAMHWLADHQTLFRRLAGQLRTGGVLAVQMPRNFEAPSHLAMLDTVQAGPWRDRLAPLVRNSPVGAPDWYVDILSPITRWQNIWETVYWHVLEGDNPVVEWMKGTALRPLLQALNHDQQRAFQSEFARRIADAYPRRSCGRTVFPFRRLFIVAGR
jgi:trans-aconitate 2-methyltransferase